MSNKIHNNIFISNRVILPLVVSIKEKVLNNINFYI